MDVTFHCLENERIGMKTLMVGVVLLLVGCGHSDYIESERAKIDACVKSGGVPRPGVWGGYSKDWVYGGCDFPPKP